MKLDKAAIKEIKHIAVGISVLDVLMFAVTAVLKYFSIQVLAAGLLGSLIAMTGFVWLCFSIQRTLEKKELNKGQMTRSYIGRMVMYAAWVALLFKFASGYAVKIAGALPVFFPSLTIKLMNLIKPITDKEEDRQ